MRVGLDELGWGESPAYCTPWGRARLLWDFGCARGGIWDIWDRRLVRMMPLGEAVDWPRDGWDIWDM